MGSCMNLGLEIINSSSFLTVSRDVEYAVVHGAIFQYWKIRLIMLFFFIKTVKLVKEAQRTKNYFYCQYPMNSFLVEK